MKFMQRVRRLFNRPLDETGQSTTEYILILLVVVMVVSRFKGMFSTIMERQVRNLGDQIDSATSGTDGNGG